jgi:Tol biopolymer transport system component
MLEDSYPYMARDTGGGVLNWAAEDTLIFASEQDGWQHLYMLPANGGEAKLLTPGNCEAEQWSFSTDRSSILYNSNCGDAERRHLWRVGAPGGTLEQLSKGESIEWGGVTLSDGKSIAYISSDARLPGRPFVRQVGKEAKTMVAEGEFTRLPSSEFVAPQAVVFEAADGLELHGQLFLR